MDNVLNTSEHSTSQRVSICRQFSNSNSNKQCEAVDIFEKRSSDSNWDLKIDSKRVPELRGRCCRETGRMRPNWARRRQVVRATRASRPAEGPRQNIINTDIKYPFRFRFSIKSIQILVKIINSQIIASSPGNYVRNVPP